MSFVEAARPMGRRMRRPVHSFQLRTRPYVIQPYMVAPVLAGETLKNFMLQSRVVTDPIKNPLVGWWKEYYTFYVKLTDIDAYLTTVAGGIDQGETEVGDRVKMLLADPTFDKTAHDFGSAHQDYYAEALTQTFVQKATDCVVSYFFRDEQDAELGQYIKGVPSTGNNMNSAMITNSGILDSAILDSAYFRTTADVDLLGDATDATLMTSEIEEAMRRYALAKANGLTDATYEDYLETFGISQAKPQKPHMPELVRYVRAWQYPSNTVDATTGIPSSAVSWSIQEKADKSRFFNEPGILLGLTVTRPKVYLSNQKSHVLGYLDRAEDWLPSILWGDPVAAMKKYALSTGPFSTQAAAYWLDMKDLYLYGDQFLNFGVAATDASMVALPTTGLQKKFPAEADVSALFVTATTKEYVREDGICNLAIASSLRDTTPKV